MQVIIFHMGNGRVALVTPAPEYADQIEAVAEKDVPEGKTWRIIDDSELPPREVRDRWLWTEEGPLDVAPEVPAVPASISFAQMLIGLVSEGWISEADGDLWMSGELPPAVISTISLLPQEQRFAARAKAMRPSYVARLDPLVEMMALAQGRSPAEVDTFFRTYANA